MQGRPAGRPYLLLCLYDIRRIPLLAAAQPRQVRPELLEQAHQFDNFILHFCLQSKELVFTSAMQRYGPGHMKYASGGICSQEHVTIQAQTTAREDRFLLV